MTKLLQYARLVALASLASPVPPYTTQAIAADPTDPIVGLLEDITITTTNAKPAHKLFIVTNRPLTEPTSFSALQFDVDTAEVLCCVRVRDTTATTIPDLLKKYGSDEEFTEEFKAIKGASYVYNAEFAPPAEQSAAMRDYVKSSSIQAEEDAGLPISMPVIQGTTEAEKYPASTVSDPSTLTAAVKPRDAASIKIDVSGGVYTFRLGATTVTIESAMWED